MEWIKNNKGSIIAICIIIVLLIVLFFWTGNHCDKRSIQIKYLTEIAEEYCSNLNKTLVGSLKIKGCHMTLPDRFTCAIKENERSIGFTDKTYYKFLEEEIEKSKSLSSF